MTTPANPLIAPRVDSTTDSSGIFILEDLQTIADGVNNNSWIEQGLGGIAFGLDALSAIANPLDAAASWATAYMIEHIQPLSDALEALAGDADQIEAFARTWDNVSNAIKTAGEALRGAIDRETLDWTGTAAEAYRQHMNEELGAMVALVKAADLLGTVVKAGGLLIAFVRQMVRDQIAQAVGAVIGALPVLLAEEGLTLGLATPAVIAQIGILLLKWINRVEHDLSLLIKSLRNLGKLVTRLDEVLKTLVALIKGLAREKPHGVPHPPRVEPPHVEPPHVEPGHPVEPGRDSAGADVWAKRGDVRGREIQERLAQTEYKDYIETDKLDGFQKAKNFPLVDFVSVDGKHAVSIKTVDVYSKKFASGETIEELVWHANELADHAPAGATRVTLDIRVPPDTPPHVMQELIDTVRDLVDNPRLDVSVRPFP